MKKLETTTNPRKGRTSGNGKAAANGVSAPEGPEKGADASGAADSTPLPPAATSPEKSERSDNLTAAARPAQGNGQVVQALEAAPQREGLPVGQPQQDTNATPKERRGRRYKTFESIRRGLASVANRVELGTLDVKQAAVAVQALNALLATVSAMKSAELERQAEQLEGRAAEAATATEDGYGEA